MKTIVKRISGMLVMASALLLCFSSCKEKENDVLVASIELEEENISVVVGQTQTLAYEILPENATNQNVIWESSDDAIATVSQEGVVSGIAPGTATITVTTEEGGKTDNCEVKVVEDAIKVTGVTVNFTSRSIKVGETTEIEATVEPADATNKNVTWSTSDENVATVEDGVITGVAAGNATITVTTEDGGFTADCEVTVSAVKVTGVSLNIESSPLKVGETLELVASIEPEDATNQAVAWTSSDEGVATVSDGVVTGVGKGTATITVTTEDGGMTAECTVNVAEEFVYVAGSVPEGGSESEWNVYPYYWINETAYPIQEGKGSARGIAMINGELYFAGGNLQEHHPCYWTADGTMTEIRSDKSAKYATMASDETNFYVIFADNDGTSYWKNGENETFVAESRVSIFDVFGGELRAVLSADGAYSLWSETSAVSPIEGPQGILDMTHSGDDVYYLGVLDGEVVYWKNGEAAVSVCADNGYSTAKIRVDGSDVYVAVEEYDVWMDSSTVSVYKNGNSAGSGLNGSLMDLVAANGSSYVLACGYGDDWYTHSWVYKDGETLFELPGADDSNYQSRGYAMIVL